MRTSREHLAVAFAALVRRVASLGLHRLSASADASAAEVTLALNTSSGPGEQHGGASDEPAPSLQFADPRIGTLEIRQFRVADRDASGLWVWAAGLRLASWLCSQDGTAFLRSESDTVAMELGCGSGLVALCLARLGLRHVLATDADADALRLCHDNAAANGVTPAVRVHPLPWGDAEAVARALDVLTLECGSSRLPRLLVAASDCFYDVDELTGLYTSIRELARGYRARGGTELDFVLAWTIRGGNEMPFVSGMCTDAKADLAEWAEVTLSVPWKGSVLNSSGLIGEVAGEMQRITIAVISIVSKERTSGFGLS